MVVATIAALVLGLVAGGITGAVAGSMTSEPKGPAAPPPMAAEFPNAGKRYLPGVTVSSVAKDLLEQANSWTCAADTESKRSSGAKQAMECSPRGEQKYDVYVNIEYDDQAQVRWMKASCHYDPGANYCKTLFAAVAGALLGSQPALRDQASKWGGQNVDSDSSAVIGGIYLEIKLSPHNMVVAPWV
jgi:hypothetical protein